MNFNINRYYTYDKAFMAKIGNEQIDYETEGKFQTQTNVNLINYEKFI